jgi:hypothetical protein
LGRDKLNAIVINLLLKKIFDEMGSELLKSIVTVADGEVF